MDYPVENAFVSSNVAAAFRRYRYWMLSAALLGSLLVGFAAWISVPVKYRCRGVFLLTDLPENIRPADGGELLSKAFRRELAARSSSDGSFLMDKDYNANLQIVAGDVVVYWSANCPSLAKCEVVAGYLPQFVKDFRLKNPSLTLDYGIDDHVSVVRKNALTLLWCVAGCSVGLLAGLLIAAGFILIFDRSIHDLREFSKSNSISILGVLPEVEGFAPDLEHDDSFLQALASLKLNVQLCKHMARRAFVIMVSSLNRGNGASTAAAHLAASLNCDGRRVLLLNNENCSMAISEHLSRNMEAALAGYSTGYDYIIIDAPDIQSSTVPLIISKLADTVLLVCDCRNCAVYPLQLALWRLRRAGANVAGAVINYFPVNKRRQDFDCYQLLFRSYDSSGK